MSTITAVGPALDLDGPLPVAPAHGLLTLDGVIVEDEPRVLNGVNVWGYPTGCSELWEPCSDGTFRTKASDSSQPTPRFDSYVVYKPVTCSSSGLSDPEELNERVSRVLDATQSAAVETAVIAGVAGSTNPFVGDANASDLTPTPGTPVTPGVGLAILENAIGETCRKGMIGATPATVATLNTDPLWPHDQLVTVNGTPIYSADGLIGLDTPTLAAGAAGTDWMVATGPIQVYLGPIVQFDTRSSLDRSDNTLVFRAERYVLSLWDTALQAAVLVNWAS